MVGVHGEQNLFPHCQRAKERERGRGRFPFAPPPIKKIIFFFMLLCLCVSEFMYTTEARQCLSPWSCELTDTGTRNLGLLQQQ